MTTPEDTQSRADAESATRWLEEHGDALFQYARQRVRSTEVAEDLVQETLIAAIGAYGRFEGRSSVRTWLTGILRRKIVDHLRRVSRERVAKQQHEQEPFFSSNGHWHRSLPNWPDDPQQSLENKEFWIALDKCCEQLTGPVSAAFRMRELEEMSTPEICKILEITPTNLSVRLHRARLMLRQCLEERWFLSDKSSSKQD